MAVPALADQVADWADRIEGTHALTLTAGCYPDRPFDPEATFKPFLKRLFSEVAHELRDHPRRYVSRMGQDEFPAFFGFYEPTTREGAPYPHIHGVIALGRGEEDHLRAILRTRWGADQAPEITGPYLRHFPALPIAPKGVCRTKRDWRPTFDLKPIQSAGWASYSAKKYRTTAIIWTHADILDLKH